MASIPLLRDPTAVLITFLKYFKLHTNQAKKKAIYQSQAKKQTQGRNPTAAPVDASSKGRTRNVDNSERNFWFHKVENCQTHNSNIQFQITSPTYGVKLPTDPCIACIWNNLFHVPKQQHMVQ
jgi:hypothetical protein